MDKIKAFLASILGLKDAVSFIARLAILAAWFASGLLTGSSTPVGDAVGIVTSKERSLAVAAELVNETPKPEIVDAVRQQTDSPAAVVQTMDNIKPAEPANAPTVQ